MLHPIIMIKITLVKLFIFTISFSLSAASNTNSSVIGEQTSNIVIPKILSKGDIKLYKEILSLQKEGSWLEADKRIDKVQNKILFGHIIYKRLLHPTKYKSTYEELENWLIKYSNHPTIMLKRIYKLSLKRVPSNITKPKPPIYNSYLRGYGEDKHGNNSYNKIDKQVRFFLNRGKQAEAIKFLRKSKKSFSSDLDYDLILGQISLSYYSNNEIDKSFKLISQAAKRSGHLDTWLSWRAGITAMRLNKKIYALENFKKCYLNKANFNNWQLSACAYWAARINFKLKDEVSYKKNLTFASKFPRSMYGHLARERLSLIEPYQWNLQVNVLEEEVTKILKYDEFVRALALVELELYGEADIEIRQLYGKLDEEQSEVLLVLAEKLHLPAVQIRLGSKLSYKQPTPIMRGLYPAPEWKLNNDNDLIDKALLFALIRKESAFYIKARSSRGARGLMQIMPRTASRIEGDRSLRGRHVRKLYDPYLNINIGQKFINKLINEKYINSSLIHTLVAYNAGSTKIRKWDYNFQTLHSDPLMFIESIPIQETRWFVKYVLTNIWIYRDRFNQNMPSREMLAYDKWPKYKNLDIGKSADARY